MLITDRLSEVNWSCLIYGGVVILASLYFVLYGRRNYDGPVGLVKQEG